MLGQLLQNRYQIVEVLNSSTFERVYFANDICATTHPKCIIKHYLAPHYDHRSRDVAFYRFTTELETLQKLAHCNQVPKLLNYIEEKSDFYLVQEYIEGYPLSHELADHIASDKRWNQDQLLDFLTQILELVDLIHEQNIIHCHIKPQNIIRRVSDGKLFLTNFSMIQPIYHEDIILPYQKNKQSSPLLAIRPWGYIPPEQLIGLACPNSDLYAIGIIAIQALTGKDPFIFPESLETGELDTNLLFHNINSSIHHQILTIIKNMVRYHVQCRYQSVQAVLDLLIDYQKHHDNETTITIIPNYNSELSINDQPDLTKELDFQPIPDNNDPPITTINPKLILRTGVGIGLTANAILIGVGAQSLISVEYNPLTEEGLYNIATSYQQKAEKQALDLRNFVQVSSPISRPNISDSFQEWSQNLHQTIEKLQRSYQSNIERSPQEKQSNINNNTKFDHLLDKANDLATNHQFGEALIYLRQIPKTSQVYSIAQIKISEYQQKQQVKLKAQKTSLMVSAPEYQ